MIPSQDNPLPTASGWPPDSVYREWQVLARYLFPVPDPQPVADLPADAWFRMARDHGLIPWFYHHRHRLPLADGFQELLETRGRVLYLNSVAQQVRIDHTLDRILTPLEQRGIVCIVLKGAALARQYYPDPATRPCGDMDLLVSPEAMPAVVEVLSDAGFECVRPEQLHPSTRAILRGHTFVPIGGAHPILDVHLRILDNWIGGGSEFSLDLVEVSETRRLAQRTMRVFRPEFQILYLCAHLVTHHLWSPRFLWLLDILLVLEQERDGMDWDRFMAWSHDTGWGLYAGLVLQHLQQLNREVTHWIPAHIWSEWTPPPSLVRRLGRLAQQEPIRAVYMQSGLAAARGRARLRFLWTTFIPSLRYMRFLHGPRRFWDWPLFYLRRWAVLLRDLVRAHRERRRGGRAKSGR